MGSVRLSKAFLVLVYIFGDLAVEATTPLCLSLQREFGVNATSALVGHETTQSKYFERSSISAGNAAQLSKIRAQFQAQLTPNLCSVASGSIAIRVLRERPFEQGDFLSDATDVIQKSQLVPVDGGGVRDLPDGQSLHQLAAMLQKIHGLQAQTYVVTDQGRTLTEFRKDLAAVTKDPRSMLIVNYQESKLSKEFPEGGHFSPVAAYDPVSDHVLIADVFQPSKNDVVGSSWFWVRTDVLYQALNSYDLAAQKNRGYLILK